jgi:hypothetical protein
MSSARTGPRWFEPGQWRQQLTVPQFTVVTGMLVIALGTMVMATPLCSRPDVGLWEALFTVTSAITVTGLSVIDVGEDLTLLGQLVLAGLIITGGVGLMAITTFLQGFVQGHGGLRARLDRGRALDEFGVGGIGPTFNRILVTGCCVMALGTAVLYGFGFGLFDANNMPVLCQFVPPRLRAAAYGFMNLIGVSAGALSTEIIGKFDQAGRLAQGIGWLAVPVIIAIALVLILRPTTLNRTDFLNL